MERACRVVTFKSCQTRTDTKNIRTNITGISPNIRIRKSSQAVLFDAQKYYRKTIICWVVILMYEQKYYAFNFIASALLLHVKILINAPELCSTRNDGRAKVGDEFCFCTSGLEKILLYFIVACERSASSTNSSAGGSCN